MKCPKCNGTGKCYQSYYTGDCGIAEYAGKEEVWCDICDGTGRATYIKTETPVNKCERCNGSGSIQEPVYTEYRTGRQIQTGSRASTCPVCNGRGQCDGMPIEYYKADYDKGGCFVSTVVLRCLGKDANCDELQILRTYRDEILVTLPNGRKMIENYYSISPFLIAVIHAADKPDELCRRLYNEYISITIEFISSKRYIEALVKYCQLIGFLMEPQDDSHEAVG